MEIEVIEPDYYYHIFNRGINRQSLFTDTEDYQKFLELCKKYILPYNDILAYCLLPNHFHLLIYTHPDGVCASRHRYSNPLGRMFNTYAQWFNFKTNRTGSLFQRPFKRIKVIKQEYLKYLVYYIHRNPVHHGLSDSISNYKYSSYQLYINNNYDFVDSKLVLQWFDGAMHFKDFHKMKYESDLDQLHLESQ